MGVALCENRPEGFGPASSIHPRLPTTCFLDVIVEPLATWIFLALMLVLLAVRMSSGRRGRPASSKFGRRERRHSGVCMRALSVLYYVLVVALLAMVSLELARLVVAELGIGLLPFNYVGVLVALGNRVGFPGWRAARVANTAFWVLLAAATLLKVVTEQNEQSGGYARVKGDGVTGNYPTSDEVLDNAVMVGVELVLAMLEVVSLATVGESYS